MSADDDDHDFYVDDDDDDDDDYLTDEERTVDGLMSDALEELEAGDARAALVTLGRLANEAEGIRDWVHGSDDDRVRAALAHEAYSLTRDGRLDEAIARLKLFIEPKWGGLLDSRSTRCWHQYDEHMREQREAEIAKRDG